MRLRTQTNNRHSAQQNDRQSEVTAGEGTIRVPPGTVLQLVDDQDEDQNNTLINLNNQFDSPPEQPDEISHRYPRRENRQRPLRYQDD